MRLSHCVLMLAVLGAPITAQAQQPGPTRTAPRSTGGQWENNARAAEIEGGSIRAGSSVASTPEMWFYEQQRLESQDTRSLILRRAQASAHQRQARLASQKWFGFNNGRPVAGVDPYNGPYSPGWSSNSYQPFNWAGTGGNTTVIYQQQ